MELALIGSMCLCVAPEELVGNTPGVLSDSIADMAFLLLVSAHKLCEGDKIAWDLSI